MPEPRNPEILLDPGRISEICHELSQWLQAYGMLSDELMPLAADPEAQSLITRMAGAVASIQSTVSAMHEAARLDGGAEQGSPVDFELDTVFKLLADQSEFKGIRIHPAKRRTHGDPGLLYRLIAGLLRYEIDYFPGEKLLLGCRHQGDQLRIEIIRLSNTASEYHPLRMHPHSELRLAVAKRVALIAGIEVRREQIGRRSYWHFALPMAHESKGTGAEKVESAGFLAGKHLLCLCESGDAPDSQLSLLQRWGATLTVQQTGAEDVASLARADGIVIVAVAASATTQKLLTTIRAQRPNLPVVCLDPAGAVPTRPEAATLILPVHIPPPRFRQALLILFAQTPDPNAHS